LYRLKINNFKKIKPFNLLHELQIDVNKSKANPREKIDNLSTESRKIF